VSILIHIVVKNIIRPLVRIFHLSLFIFGPGCQISNGQSITELRKLWQSDNFAYTAENNKDKLFSRADFYKYVQTCDNEFADYLKESWNDYSIFAGLSDGYPRRLVQEPVFNNSDFVMNPPENLPYSKMEGFNYNGLNQIKMVPRIRKPESGEFNQAKGIFKFYGQPISITYDKLLALSKINSFSEDSISEFWKSFARSNSNYLVDQLMNYRDLLGLGDWGYFQLVKAASNHIFTNNQLNVDLLTWALMIRSGYDVRFAFNQSSVTILFPSENTIYSRQFIVIGQKRFYFDREMNSQLLITCQNPFPGNVRMIDLEFYKTLNFNGKLLARKVLYQWDHKNYEFILRYNPYAIQFYNDYPNTESAVYFRAPVLSTLKEDILGQFYPVLSKMKKPEAVAFLQQLVQKGFNYTSENQKDESNLHRFAEQIIASKSGDDRGKSVLFSWLIRILLRSPVAGMQFPGYYSTAVSFDETLDGDFYSINKKKYYLADPTFRNAPIGIILPELSGQIPQLIGFSNDFSWSDEALKVWELASKLGARRGGSNPDIIFDQQGRALITGYFANKNSYYPFIARFSPDNSLQWIRKFEGDGKAVAFAITKVSDDEIYVAGSFSGKLVMDGVELQSGIDETDLFIAQFNQNGELTWMNKVGINSNSHDESLVYTVIFDRSGEDISIQWCNEDERNIKTGFGDTKDNKLCFISSENSTPGMVTLSWMAKKPDISDEIYKEYKLLIGSKCHPKVAGIIAVMKLLQKIEPEITGIQLQKLITHYNSSFPVNNPGLFKSIGLIRQLKNENGNLLLRTVDGKPVMFGNLRLGDSARFSLSAFGNGDLSIGIISGFHIIVNQTILPLNNLLIDCSSGNIILDYDPDHTLKTVSFGISSK
jgi:hypothetical protein